MRTKGISPKLIAPAVAAVTPLVSEVILTGSASRTTLSAVAVAILGLIAAWFSPAGTLVEEGH